MPRTSTIGSFATLLDRSSRPVYVIDAERQIVYCNRALADWLALGREQIVGRLVEYHSAPVDAEPASARPDSSAPLTDLCPSPRALAGEACRGTIACQTPDGRLLHRLAEFLPMGLQPRGRAGDGKHPMSTSSGCIVLLAERDLSPPELAAQLKDDPTTDALHRTIRQFRRKQSRVYAIETLLGASPAVVKVRAQVAAAAASGANTLIRGRRGSGRGHVARTIHYLGSEGAEVKLMPLDCNVLNEELLQRALDGLRGRIAPGRPRHTVLLEHLEQLSAACQSQLLTLLRQEPTPARFVATISCEYSRPESREPPAATAGSNAAAIDEAADGERPSAARLDASLVAALSTITIEVPRLAERIEDLPLLAQFLLEECNRESPRQVGSIRRDALDLLALHTWPGEVAELRDVIAAAHRACTSYDITPADLPAVIGHAAQAAARPQRLPERIQLDEFLAGIEKEVLVRALGQARGNKSEAAELLGITRPRLYRRMVQLGLVSEPATEEAAQPEFIERDDAEDSP